MSNSYQSRYPHDVDGGFSIAEMHAQGVSDAVRNIERSIIRTDHIAYMQSSSMLSISTIVNFDLGISERRVAMVHKLKDEIKSYIFSIRRGDSCEAHLGMGVNQISTKIGRSGGGHEKACGAEIPREKFNQFINMLDRLVV